MNLSRNLSLVLQKEINNHRRRSFICSIVFVDDICDAQKHSNLFFIPISMLSCSSCILTAPLGYYSQQFTLLSSMAKKSPSYDHVVEDDYIDMDISSTTLCYSKPSPPPPPHLREFEFQMSFNLPGRETTPSPADELFYKGKLLPLHLPPRLQMVQKLLQNSNSHGKDTDTDTSEGKLAAAAAAARSSPFESCKISPASSCHVSGELSPEEYMHECCQTKKSWSRKLKLIKQSSLGLRLNASKAYLRSLFTNKSGCPEELNAVPKAKDCSSGYLKAEKKNSFSQLMADTSVTTLMRSIERDKLLEEECLHRKSFSGAINCHLTTRSSPAISSSSSSSSSFSSVNSNRFYGSQMLNRSSSANSEMESSIQGAIAYCKKSQLTARKSASDVEFCSLSASRIVTVCENKEKPGL